MMLTLDASVAVKWIATEPGSRSARAYLPNVSKPETERRPIIAPATILMEVHHALAKQFDKNQITFEQLSTASTFIRLFCEILPVDAAFVHQAALLSLTANPQVEGHLLKNDLKLFSAGHRPRYKPFSIYDCSYIALARESQSMLLTADRQQAEVARAFNIPVEFVAAE